MMSVAAARGDEIHVVAMQAVVQPFPGGPRIRASLVLVVDVGGAVVDVAFHDHEALVEVADPALAAQPDHAVPHRTAAQQPHLLAVASAHQVRREQRRVEHQTFGAISRALGEGTRDRGAEAQPADVEPVDLEMGQQIEDQVCHRRGRVPPTEWRGRTVPREIRNDQRPIFAEFAETAAELLRGAEEPVAEHQRLSLSADKVAKCLTADLDEPLVHHQRIIARFGRDPSGQVRVKTGRRA